MSAKSTSSTVLHLFRRTREQKLFKLFRNSSSVLLLTVSVLAVTSRYQLAFADENQLYYRFSCDSGNGIARIDARLAHVGKPPDGYTYSASNMPNAFSIDQAFPWITDTAPPLVVCKMDSRRTVALKAYSGSTPYGGLFLYIGSRLFPYALTFKNRSYIVVSKESPNFVVDVGQCDYSNSCSHTEFTPPSFSCSRANSVIESGICLNNTLSGLDVRLSDTYNLALSTRPALSRDNFINAQREWMLELEANCTNLQPHDSWQRQPYLMPKAAECVEAYYVNRTKALMDLTRAN